MHAPEGARRWQELFLLAFALSPCACVEVRSLSSNVGSEIRTVLLLLEDDTGRAFPAVDFARADVALPLNLGGLVALHYQSTLLELGLRKGAFSLLPTGGRALPRPSAAFRFDPDSPDGWTPAATPEDRRLPSLDWGAELLAGHCARPSSDDPSELLVSADCPDDSFEVAPPARPALPDFPSCEDEPLAVQPTRAGEAPLAFCLPQSVCPAGEWPPEEDVATLHVSPGALPGGDGSRAAPLRELGEALRTAARGTTVLLGRGLYRGSFEVPEAVTLRGVCRGEVVIQSASGGPALSLDEGAKLKDLTSTSTGTAIWLTGVRAEIEGVLAGSDGGPALDVRTGAYASVRSTSLECERGTCLHISGAGATVDVDRAFVRVASPGGARMAVDVRSGARLEGRRLWVRIDGDDPAGPGGIAVSVRAGAALSLEDAVLQAELGPALHVAEAGSTSWSRLIVEAPEGPAIVIRGSGAQDMTDVLLTRVGLGLFAQNVRAEVTRMEIIEASDLGVGIASADLTLRDYLVHRTGKNALGMGEPDGRALVERMRVGDAAWSAIKVDDGALSATDVEVSASSTTLECVELALFPQAGLHCGGALAITASLSVRLDHFVLNSARVGVLVAPEAGSVSLTEGRIASAGFRGLEVAGCAELEPLLQGVAVPVPEPLVVDCERQ